MKSEKQKPRVPNQRAIEVNKTEIKEYIEDDPETVYTKNQVFAIDEAAIRLQSAGGFKLYMYLAKNKNGWEFNLSSRAFMNWSGLKNTAYNTAFKELVDEGYLVLKPGTKEDYIFYDRSQIKDKIVKVEIHKENQDAENKNFIF